ncbi:coiled-coil domain-containing protein 112 isoform X1 [Cervus canadensis]|uniref:coiled-coil domain-containing protein 112 isoform X1 n=1 Tax=Cervus canadensis TaxID=1574408 RepID=UPI001C9E5A07|nr:coiled-coil domain-containing protein 112 isoform X1 [Cervus canadensis]
MTRILKGDAHEEPGMCPGMRNSVPSNECGCDIKICSKPKNDGCLGTSGGIRPFQLQNWKQKVNRTKKTEFIRTAEKFKNQVINLEKDKHSHFYNQKSDFRIEHSMLEELENKLINSRKTERAKIQQQLAKIYNNVKKLQHQLKDAKPTPDFVEKLREMMEEIENAINTFKEEQRLIYEELIKEEKTTSNEVSAISRKLDTWAVGDPGAEKTLRAAPGKLPADRVTPSALPAAVAEFEMFLQQTGGRQGGWDDYDHQNFVKARTKHKGKPAFMGEVLEHLPGRTQDEVQQHEKWYQKFLALEERKKESIQHWKTKKQQKMEEIFKLKEKDSIQVLSHNKQEDNQKQKEEQRKKQKLAIEAWKKQRSIEMAMKSASQLKEEEEKEKQQQRARQRQCKLKLLLETYTQQKKEQAEFLRLEKEIREKTEKAERRKTAADEISRFQERDLHKLELKILNRQLKEDEKAEKQRKLAKLKEKVENNVSRDPSRLYKPTKGWEERTKKIGPAGSGPLLHIPHRAIPTWRQGV